MSLLPIDKCTLGHDLQAAAGVTMAAAATLSDSTPGSPRSIAIALAGLLFVIGSYLARKCSRTNGTSPNQTEYAAERNV